MSGEASEVVTPVIKRGYWRREDARVAVEAWQRSGETLAAFSRRHGLDPRRLRRWRKRLGRGGDPERTAAGAPVQFHPVQLVRGRDGGEERGAPFEVVLPEGCTVRVPPGFAAADLARVLQVLAGEAAC